MSDSVQVVTTPAKLSVSVVETEAEFARLETVWNRLALSSSRPVPFLTWEWISTWWKHFHGDSRLFVLVARDEEKQVVGIAPLRIAVRRAFGVVPVRTVEFLGYRGSVVCADYLDFLSTGDNREEILRTLAEAIMERSYDWDSVLLAGAPEDSLLPGILSECARRLQLYWHEGPSQVCPCLPLPSTWQTLLTAMNSKRRYLLKRRGERLSRDFEVKMTYTVAPEQIHDNLETLARLHSSCRQRKGQPGNFCVPEYLNFHHEVAERMARAGYLYLAQLRCNARPVAALYGFHLGTVLFGYQVGYSNAFAVHGVGSLLQGFTIQDAIERLHATEYDFLQGDEAYKYSWTKHRRQTRAIVLWKRNLAGELSRREFLLRRRLSPGKQRVQILWESAGQHLRSAYRNTLAPTRGQ